MELQLHVLVVDDEPRQRRGVAALVRQLRPGYTVHEARNGQEALELSLAHPVDLVLTDIQMPVMNGMDYINQVRKSLPELRIVLITVYDEFHYVQQAIRLNVMDYLIKPVTAVQLLPLLESIEQEQIQRRIQLEQQQSLSRQLARLEPIYQEHLLYRWLTGSLNIQEQEECQRYFRIDGEISIWLMRRMNVLQQPAGDWKMPLREHLEAAVSGGISLYYTGMDDPEEPLIIIVQWPHFWQEKDRQTCRDQVITVLEQLHADHNVDICTAESELFSSRESAQGVHLAYQSAAAALERHFYEADSCWLMGESGYSTSRASQRQPIRYPSTASIESAIHKRDRSVMEQEMDDLLKQLAADHPSVPLLKYHLLQIMLPCIERSSAHIGQELKDQYAQRLEFIIQQSARLQQLRMQLLTVLSEWLEQIDSCRMSKSDQAMLECREYLERHYHEDLSLDEVAGRFYYNPSYFSLLFKSHFGTSFTDYIQRLRMQHARTLLLETNDRIAEIGRQTGYRDIKYFAKVFKKSFLYTPEEYRRQFRRSDILADRPVSGRVSRPGVD
ncbi:response regulator [Paenibacillus wulumuqiensis]|uniref:response regulator n=1 Tax=Paenibacillus wulumuqiensis TaxID=1567107 RepID=UPI000619139B|nr:response regulator [Paenibacillus wulumuqiensis]